MSRLELLDCTVTLVISVNSVYITFVFSNYGTCLKDRKHACKLPHQRRLNFQRLVFFLAFCMQAAIQKTEKTEGGDFMALTRPKDSPSESCQRNSATRSFFSCEGMVQMALFED